MSEYRGIKEPKPYGSGDRWTINDGAFGYFTGYSERRVLEEWRGKVRKFTEADALESANYGFMYGDETSHECQKCGAVVSSPYLHNKWHSRQEDV